MTHTIVIGPHPGQPGACIAQYNHYTYSHSPKHYFSNHNPLIPAIQKPNTVHGQYWIPTWRPPGNSFPSLF